MFTPTLRRRFCHFRRIFFQTPNLARLILLWSHGHQVQTEFPPDYARSRIDAFYQEHFAWLEVSNVERFCGVLPLSGHGRSLMAYNYWTLNFEVLPSTLLCNSNSAKMLQDGLEKEEFQTCLKGVSWHLHFSHQPFSLAQCNHSFPPRGPFWTQDETQEPRRRAAW